MWEHFNKTTPIKYRACYQWIDTNNILMRWKWLPYTVIYCFNFCFFCIFISFHSRIKILIDPKYYSFKHGNIKTDLAKVKQACLACQSYLSGQMSKHFLAKIKCICATLIVVSFTAIVWSHHTTPSVPCLRERMSWEETW